MFTKPKTFAGCSLYAKTNAEGLTAEKQLIDFLLNGQRINYGDPSFKNIRDNLKSRVNAAVLYRLLQNGGINFVIAKRELPSAFKIFYAKDPRSASRHKAIFVDVTGLIYEQNGVFYCKDIDKFSTYLLGVLANYLYYLDNSKLLRNGNLQRASVSAFCKMFGGLLDYLRVTGYLENRPRILYITGVYFGTNVMGLDMATARKVSMVANKLTAQEAKAADYYYVAEDEFIDIDSFCNSIINTFKLKDLTTGVVLDRWYFLYGKGTHFALELYPAFLQTVLYAYSGTYLNNWKRIESVIGRDMTDIATMILKIGSESIQQGFAYESAENRDYYERRYISEAPDPTKATTPQQGQTNIVKQRQNAAMSKSLENKAHINANDIQKVVTANADKIKDDINAQKSVDKGQPTKPATQPTSPKVNTSTPKPANNNNTPKPSSTPTPKPINTNSKPSNSNTSKPNDVKPVNTDNDGPAENNNGPSSPKKESTECLVDHLDDDFNVPEAGEKDTLYKDILDDNPMDTALAESIVDDVKKRIKHNTDMKALYKDWGEKSKSFVTHRWIDRLITPQQEEMLKKHFDIMNAEDVSYGDYKKSFNQICKFMGLPNKGIILEWFEIQEDKEGKSGGKKAAVRYSKGLAQVQIPADVQLLHISPADDIKELIPSFKSKTGGKYFYPSKRCFFTVDKEIDIWRAGNVGKKTTKYVTKDNYTTAYIDPTYNTIKDRSVYIETENPIPVMKVEDKFRDVKNAIMSKYYQVTGAKKIKKMEEKESETKQRKIADVKAEIEQKKAEKAAAKNKEE